MSSNKTAAARHRYSTREATVRLLSSAERIFISYSHGDLREAMRVRRKIVTLRRAHPQDTVFLDQDSFIPGENVSPAVIDAKIREADVFVLICGDGTPRSVEVRREIDISLERRDSGACIVLPIILRPRTVLPDRIDYAIQGIFLTRLFPEILYARVVAAGVAVALAGLSLWLFGRMRDADHQRRVAEHERVREEVMRGIAVDELSPQVPTDLPRRDRLASLLTTAEANGLDDAKTAIGRRLARLVGPSARVELLPPDATRLYAALLPSGARLYLGYPGRIDVLDVSSGHIDIAVDLASIWSLIPAEAPPEWHWLEDSSGGGLRKRAPAHLTKLLPGRFSDGVFFEVEYEDFGLLALAREVDRSDGERTYKGDGFYSDEPEERSEREVFELRLGLPSPVSHGLSRELTWIMQHDHGGEEHGRSWYEIDRERKDSFWRHWHNAPWWVFTRARHTRPTNSLLKLKCIGFEPVSQQALVVINDYGTPEENDGYVDVETTVYVLLVERGRKPRRLTKVTSYLRNARQIYWVDQEGPLHTDVMPEFAPAAIQPDSSHVCLRDRLGPPREIQSESGDFEGHPVDLDWDSVSAVRFATDGQGLVLQFKDDSVGYYEISSTRLTRRLLRPPQAKALLVTANADRVLVLYENGRLESWDFAAFGADGWAAAPSSTP